LFFGQCSEICGINHGFMPIAIYITNYEEYFFWCVANASEIIHTEMVKTLN
jgi:cytochrome c oxidase subunit 2